MNSTTVSYNIEINKSLISMACQCDHTSLKEYLSKNKQEPEVLNYLLDLVCLQSGIGYDKLIHKSVDILIQEGAIIRHKTFMNTINGKDTLLAYKIFTEGNLSSDSITLALLGTVSNGNIIMVKWLLDNGADPTRAHPDQPEHTPKYYIQFCASPRDAKIVLDMLDAESDLKVV